MIIDYAYVFFFYFCPKISLNQALFSDISFSFTYYFRWPKSYLLFYLTKNFPPKYIFFWPKHFFHENFVSPKSFLLWQISLSTIFLAKYFFWPKSIDSLTNCCDKFIFLGSNVYLSWCLIGYNLKANVVDVWLFVLLKSFTGSAPPSVDHEAASMACSILTKVTQIWRTIQWKLNDGETIIPC